MMRRGTGTWKGSGSSRAASSGSLLPVLTGVLALVVACGGTADGGDPVGEAVERSRAIAAGEWLYGQDTLPPEQGGSEARIVDRCRVTVEGESGTEARTLDAACGLIFLGLDAGVDSARVERLTAALDVEVVERGAIPAWTTKLGEPVEYLLVRVEPGREGRTLERALDSEGVRFVDVREVARRRP